MALLQLNYALFQDINAPAGANPVLDAFMVFCANWLIFLWPLLLLCVWGIPLRWRKSRGGSDREFVLEIRRAAVMWTAIACLLAYALNLLVEHMVFEPRPFVNHTVHLLVSHAADASFPSDHAAWSFAVVGMLFFALLLLNRPVAQKQSFTSGNRESRNSGKLQRLRLPLLLLLVALAIAILIGFARVFVGIHYPGDILGGAVDGIIASGVATALCRWLDRPTRAILQFAAFLHLA